MATATKRFMNWTNVIWTPTLGDPVTLTGVSSVAIDSGGSLAKFAADGDRYNTTVVNDFNEPSMKVSTADLGALSLIPYGQEGTLRATNNDAKNGATTGAITYTLLGIVSGNSASGGHRKFSEGQLMIEGLSADGTTNPLSTSIVP